MSVAANSIDVSTVGIVNFNGAFFDSPSITQYSTLVGDANSNIQNVSPGTAGQVLTSQGASSVPHYADLPASGFVWASLAIDATAVVQHGYLATVALTLTLPTAPADGSIVGLSNASNFGTPEVVVLQAGAGDLIQQGNAQSTAAGTATSSISGNALQLVYVASTNTWISVIGSQGTWILA